MEDGPSWFVYGDGDKNIPPAAQAFMAERAKSMRRWSSKALRTS